jgi:hypothetical protein
LGENYRPWNSKQSLPINSVIFLKRLVSDNEVKGFNNDEREKVMKDRSIFGGIYGMAFIGAAIYFIQNAATFWQGVFGFFKALFWPAVLMYKLLQYLKM